MRRLLAPRLGILVVPEVIIRVSPTHYRVPDLSVRRDDNIGDRIPTARHSWRLNSYRLKTA
jgi:hypothetical protein